MSENSTEKDIAALEAAIDFNKQDQKLLSSPPSASQSDSETVSAMSHEEFKAAAEQTLKDSEPKSEPRKEGSFSFFEDLSKPTQEDSFISDSNRAETLLNEAISPVNPEDDKKAYKIEASMYIEMFDYAICFACSMIVGDNTHDSQKRFTLHPDKKKYIASKLAEVLEVKKVKSNPYMAIIMAGLVFYAPMIYIAWQIRQEKKNIAKQPVKSQGLPQYQQQTPAYQGFNNQNQNSLIVNNANNTANHFEQNSILPPIHEMPMGPSLKNRGGVKKGSVRGPYKKKPKTI